MYHDNYLVYVEFFNDNFNHFALLIRVNIFTGEQDKIEIPISFDIRKARLSSANLGFVKYTSEKYVIWIHGEGIFEIDKNFKNFKTIENEPILTNSIYNDSTKVWDPSMAIVGWDFLDRGYYRPEMLSWSNKTMVLNFHSFSRKSFLMKISENENEILFDTIHYAKGINVFSSESSELLLYCKKTADSLYIGEYRWDDLKLGKQNSFRPSVNNSLEPFKSFIVVNN